jgi:proteasome accessory factor B
VSRKIERLINLTIALLATKRYLTKSEIFKTIEGYEGSAESKERMFERDKDDLRSLGIEIEVGSFDPLFSDEAGYRIKQEKYQFDLGEITPVEVSLLSLAAQAWQEASFGDVAQSALLKLKSMGIPGDELLIPIAVHKLDDGGQDISLISKAIASHQQISFEYLDANLSTTDRKVVPLSLSSRSGFWYIAGVDQDVQEIRTFRLDRIRNQITAGDTPSGFEAPEGFSAKASVSVMNPNGFAVIDLRKGKGAALRALASSLQSLGEWDQLKIPIFNLESLSALILWHGLDVIVQEPESLKNLIIDHLEALVGNHG